MVQTEPFFPRGFALKLETRIFILIGPNENGSNQINLFEGHWDMYSRLKKTHSQFLLQWTRQFFFLLKWKSVPGIYNTF